MPGAAVAIDLENILISSAEAGQTFEGYAGTEMGFENMFKWIRTFAEILCVYLYLPASQSGNDHIWDRLWKKHKEEFLFEAIYCPRKTPQGPRERRDNVDEHLICHSKRILELFGSRVSYFVLASGDSDYSGFLWNLNNMGLKIAFELGSEKSFSRIYRQVNLAATHPSTGAELIHYFSPRAEE